MKAMIAGTILALALAGPGLAQTRTVEVVAQGHASRTPDKASVAFMLRAEAQTAEAALRGLREVRAKVEADLPAAAAGRLEISASKLGVEEIRPRGCAGYEVREAQAAASCRVIAYVASIDLVAWVRPPERAGQVLVRAAELGAIEPRFGGSEVDNSAPLRNEAIADAMADARVQATQYARAAGANLGPVLSVKVEPVFRMSNPAANMAAIGDDQSLRVGATEETVNIRVVFAMN